MAAAPKVPGSHKAVPHKKMSTKPVPKPLKIPQSVKSTGGSGY